MKFKETPKNLPTHIAFIMDGNGRWATKRLLPRKAGHRAGVNTMKKTIEYIVELGIPYITLFAFSTENKNRPKDEVEAIFNLMKEYFKSFLQDVVNLGIHLRFMGELTYFPEDLRKIFNEAIEKSKEFTKCTLNIAMNYGSRDELIRAVNKAVAENKAVTEKSFSSYLYTDGMPDPDLIVRTSGEMRLSNFMLYQAAYSELFFTPTLWPDFNKDELHAILTEYSKRNRRFGKI